MPECYEFEECEYNGQPRCYLPDGVDCPHGVGAGANEGEHLMDIEKLIERLRNNNIENNCHDCALGYYAFEAATALSTLQAEKEKLMVRNTKLEDTIRSQRNGLQELRAELEQVTRERDAAIGDIYSGNANDCDTCLHGCDYNNDCPIETGGECKYKWRGLQREN